MALAPIRREVLVSASPDTAFRVFTDDIGRWWPVARHSVSGAGASVGFADGHLVEVSPSGDRFPWGAVTDWQPGVRVAFTWHPGRGAEDASAVEVGFEAVGAQTRVTLVHSGWEVFADPEAAREEYENGWPTVLGAFVGCVGEAA
jgi:uncharacterized protein YndB with AHSA1/START domain